MQTLIQVYSKGTGSLRKKINDDKAKEDYDFYVQRHSKKGTQKSWLKLKQNGENGTLNIEWSADTKILTVRVINRAEGRPATIVGNFIYYIMEKFSKEIKSIHIITAD